MGSESVVRRPYSRRQSVWVAAVLLTAAGIVTLIGYRREVLIYYVHYGPEFLLGHRLSLVPYAASAQEELLTRQVSEARKKSPEALLAAIRSMLQSGNPGERILGTAFAEDLEDSQCSLLAPELVSLLATDWGGVSINAKGLLVRLGPLAAPGAEGLAKILRTGEPDWRRSHAAMILERIGPAASSCTDSVADCVLAESDVGVRLAAFRALISIAPADSRTIRVAEELAEKGDTQIKSKAQRFLESIRESGS